jgi:hypothetical protein
MKAIRFGNGFAIFIIFFGVAALQAFTSGSWTRTLFWLAIGAAFLIADNVRKHEQI